MTKSKKKVCVAIFSRANYGSIRKVLEHLKKSKKINLQILTGGSANIEKFGLISLGMNTAIIEYYPVKIYGPDILMIIILVFIITILASIKPSQIALQKINLTQFNNK